MQYKEEKVTSIIDNFECMHNKNNICAYTLEKCDFGCKWNGNCGQCKTYYIPAGQEPCKSCFRNPLAGNS